MEAAPVIDLAEFAKAQRARGALVRLLGDWGWFLRAQVEVKPSGHLVIVAITTTPCSSSVRRDIYVCIPSHVNGFPVETRPLGVGNRKREPDRGGNKG